MKKLEHYGVENDAIDVIISFLNDRKRFVEIQAFSSPTLDNLPCSVIQGSKLMGFLYMVYYIESLLLPGVLKDRRLAEEQNDYWKSKYLTTTVLNIVQPSSLMIPPMSLEWKQ